MIIKELFSNLAILVFLLLLYSQLTKNDPLSLSSSIKRKILIGVTGGLMSNILMHYAIRVGDTIIDLRHIPLILLAATKGPFPAIIVMIFIIVGRLFIGINVSSFICISFIVSLTIFSIFISKWPVSRNIKIFLMLTFTNIYFTCSVLYLIQDTALLLRLIPLYCMVSYLGGYVAFYTLDVISKRQMLFEKYKEESKTDKLTGLCNVRRFNELFNQLVEEAESKNQPLSLLYIDIDFFKKVNDTYGHKGGDDVLKQLGSILETSVRSADFVSRNGGEEFTVLLVNCPLKNASQIAENIRSRVEGTMFQLGCGKKIKVTVSIGAASYQDSKDKSVFFNAADKALYQAKVSGRNKVCIASQMYEH